MGMIHGVLSQKESTGDQDSIRRMCSAVEPFTGNSFDYWNDRSITLAANPSEGLPMARREQKPILVDDKAGLVIVADARIDNRADLLSALALASGAGAPISDLRLILLAYEKWGEGCAERLIGDFAFAIWDGRERSLFCARDVFGMRPFYFYHDGERFLFSSDIAALLALQEIPRRIDEGYIVDTLGGLHLYTNKTPFRDIHCLGKAHWLRVTDGKVKTGRYWQPNLEQEIRLGGDAEYVARYLELFTQAVECRLASDDPVASFISGGLDSSSITAVAGRLLEKRGMQVHGYCHVLPEAESNPDEDERHLVALLGRQPGIDLTWVTREIFDWEASARAAKDPWNAENPFMQTSLTLARSKGCRVFLGGFGGDQVATCHAHHLVAWLVHQRDWRGFYRQARGIARDYQRTTLRAAIGLLRQHYPFAPEPTPDRVIEEFLFDTCLFNREFAERFDALAMARKAHRFSGGNPKSFRESMWNSLYGGVNPHNSSAAIFARAGLEARHPMFDRRLVEFCLAVPPEQHRLGRHGRRLIRRAMEGILPDEIRLRHNKRYSASPGFQKDLLGLLDERKAIVAQAREVPQVARYIDLDGIQQRLDELPSLLKEGRQKEYKSGATGRALMLARFLTEHFSNGGST